MNEKPPHELGDKLLNEADDLYSKNDKKCIELYLKALPFYQKVKVGSTFFLEVALHRYFQAAFKFKAKVPQVLKELYSNYNPCLDELENYEMVAIAFGKEVEKGKWNKDLSSIKTK